MTSVAGNVKRFSLYFAASQRNQLRSVGFNALYLILCVSGYSITLGIGGVLAL